MASFFLLAWSFPHYFAPATCVLYGAVALAMRNARLFRPRGLPVGLLFCRLAVLGLVLATADSIANGNVLDNFGGTRMQRRADITNQLQQMPGKQLVFVRYSPAHNIHLEWVYNDADLARAKIVWVREMDMEQNRRVLEYFKDRESWLIEPDNAAIPLRRYEASMSRDIPTYRSSAAAR